MPKHIAQLSEYQQFYAVRSSVITITSLNGNQSVTFVQWHHLIYHTMGETVCRHINAYFVILK